ncbi:MAG TPA: hypothetical protein VMZ71_14200 [Gemmataceae bacterium]|nr:hypothetical protein [Gemmataceae bacterium]
MRHFFAALLFAGCGDRTPVFAQQPAVAPAPRAVTPEVQAAKARLAAAEEELRREQRLRATGASSTDRVEVAELRVHFATTALALASGNLKAEHASREAEVVVLTRRWVRAKENGAKSAEFAEQVDARLRELAEGRARLAVFNGDRAALLKAHATLVEVAERRLERAQHLFERKVGPAAEVKRCELAALNERDRLAAAKTARLFPRRAD